ncbi:MAG: hypothetical protein ACOY46_03085 [Bacillota bacterium]
MFNLKPEAKRRLINAFLSGVCMFILSFLSTTLTPFPLSIFPPLAFSIIFCVGFLLYKKGILTLERTVYIAEILPFYIGHTCRTIIQVVKNVRPAIKLIIILYFLAFIGGYWERVGTYTVDSYINSINALRELGKIDDSIAANLNKTVMIGAFSLTAASSFIKNITWFLAPFVSCLAVYITFMCLRNLYLNPIRPMDSISLENIIKRLREKGITGKHTGGQLIFNWDEILDRLHMDHGPQDELYQKILHHYSYLTKSGLKEVLVKVEMPAPGRKEPG